MSCQSVNKPLVILGSARKNSDTRKLVENILSGIKFDLVDLLDHHISPYNYSGTYPSKDSFIRITEQMKDYNVVIFATPVYWYSMSGRLKTFFDRFTDLVTLNKQLGYQLKGIHTFLIAVGTDQEAPAGFENPFRLTSEYMKMKFENYCYSRSDMIDRVTPGSEQFVRQIKSFL